DLYAVRLEAERPRDHAAGHLGPHQQLERRVGRLERPAVRLELLYPLGDAGQRLRVAAQVDAELAALQLDARPAGHLGDQDPHVVADGRRLDVVVQQRIHLDRTRV